MATPSPFARNPGRLYHGPVAPTVERRPSFLDRRLLHITAPCPGCHTSCLPLALHSSLRERRRDGSRLSASPPGGVRSTHLNAHPYGASLLLCGLRYGRNRRAGLCNVRPTTGDLLPSRTGARWNGPALRAGPAAHRRIMQHYAFVQSRTPSHVGPFQRTPVWPPSLRIRLAHSPHAPGLRPPFGLKQNPFCSLASSPRRQGS